MLSLGCALVLVTMLVAGCSSSSPPPVDPPGTPGTLSTPFVSGTSGGSETSKGTADPSSWPPVPAAANAHTPKGAEASARYYFTAVNYAWSTPDPTVLRPLATANCKSCANYVKNTELLVRLSERWSHDSVHVVTSEALPTNSPDRVNAMVAWRSPATPIVDFSGKTKSTSPKQGAISEFAMKWRDNHWLVDKIYVSEVAK
jgi:Family of unknown function (DUF6318)